MKARVFSFAVAVILLAVFVGCINGNGNPETPPPDGEKNGAPILVGFPNEPVTINADGGEDNIIYIAGGTGKPSSITFSASGFEKIRWFIDDGKTPASTADSVTIQAATAGLTLGVHSVSFTGFKGDRLYSESVIFSVYP